MTSLLVAARRPLAALALLACVLSGFVLAGGGGAIAASPDTVRPGLGRQVGADFVGFYVTRSGAKVYCLVPRKGTPTSVSLRTVGTYPGLSTAASAALGYALATWGDARTHDAAAVASQVVNTLVGNHGDVARRNRHLPASLRRLVATHVALAQSLRGPYSLQLSTGAAPLPGASAVGRVRLVSATGRPVPGAAIALRTSANASALPAVRTDRQGGASFRYSVTDVGEVRLLAAASGLPNTAVRISDPMPGQQRLAGPAASVSAPAASAFRAAVGGFSHRYSCTSECAGRPPVTLSACAPASRLAIRIVYRVADRVVVTNFGPDRLRRCAAQTVVGSDGATVSAAWQFLTTHGWSRPIPAGSTFVVDCPMPASIDVHLVYDCEQAQVTVGLTRPAAAPAAPGRSPRRTLLVVSGARSAQIVAEPGQAASWTATTRCGTPERLTFHSGVQRLDGSWNHGRPATVITP